MAATRKLGRNRNIPNHGRASWFPRPARPWGSLLRGLALFTPWQVSGAKPKAGLLAEEAFAFTLRTVTPPLRLHIGAYMETLFSWVIVWASFIFAGRHSCAHIAGRWETDHATYPGHRLRIP